jgi:hypothetical protein
MGRKISAFKRNRRGSGSFKIREVSESKGDKDEVAEEEEDDSEIETPRKGSKKLREEDLDLENVKRGAGKHRVRKSYKNDDRWETEP